MTAQFQRVGPCVAAGAVKGITLVSSEFAKAPGAPSEGSGWPVKKVTRRAWRSVDGHELPLATDGFAATDGAAPGAASGFAYRPVAGPGVSPLARPHLGR